MRKRNLIVALAGVLSVLLLSPADARLSSSSGSAVAKLGLGDFKFWDHDTPAPTPCTGVELPECVEWTLEVTEPGGRLRVALDHPTEAFHLLDVIDPSGHSIASADDRLRSYGVGMTNHIVTNDVYYSSELFGEDAPVGRWSVRVTPPRNGAEVDFRMRAKLEAPRPAPKKKAALLPNLQVVPPYRFSFGCQAGWPTEELPPPVGYSAQHCLRFAYGVSNVGDGPLDLVFPPFEGVTDEGEATQRIHYTDGSTRDRPAGAFTYHPHPTHMHYHTKAIGPAALYRVVDSKPWRYEEIPDASPKVGYCMIEVLIAEWHKFRSQPPNPVVDTWFFGCGAGNPKAPAGGRVLFAAGWADIYPPFVEGNYVEFPTDGDGEYVLVVTSDANDTLLESKETDNLGYTYVRVSGEEVEILERGRGEGPWDKKKVIVNDTRQ